MTRHRAQRLAEIATSKGVKAKYYASAPRVITASSRLLYSVVLVMPGQRKPVWCYSTKDFFSQIKTLESCQPDTAP